jgi:hypothetical protein
LRWIGNNTYVFGTVAVEASRGKLMMDINYGALDVPGMSGTLEETVMVGVSWGGMTVEVPEFGSGTVEVYL